MKLKRALSFLFSLFTVIYFEAILRIFTIGAFDARFIHSVIFAVPAALLLHTVTLLSGKAVK